MALQMWLPLNGDIHNQGLLNLNSLTPSQNTMTFNDAGKIGKCGTGMLAWHLTEDILDNTWSVATWFKTSSSFSPYNNIIFCKNSTQSTDCQIYFSIINGTSLNVGVNGPSESLGQSYTFATNTWYHVATTYDGTKVSLYINGVFQKSTNVTTAKPNGRLNIRINGRSTNAGNTSATGQLAGYSFNDFRLYDHALSAAEVAEIAKGLIIHYKLDNNGWLFPNLITKSSYETEVWTNSSSNLSYVYDEDKGYKVKKVFVGGLHNKTSASNGPMLDLFNISNYKENTQYTISFDMKEIRTDNKNTNLYMGFVYTDGTITDVRTLNINFNEWKHFSLTSTINKTISRTRSTYGSGEYILLDNIKLVESPIEKDGYIPIDEISTTIYDCSGYQNNGTIIGNLTAAASSPRYGIGTVFNGSNSAIKVIDNNWISQGREAMTINLWTKSSAWGGAHFFSCTEGGGFNTEAGNSGNLRFPINVYTNAEKTSHAYKYDSNEIQLSALPTNEWVMLTFVYDATGTKTYMNGQLHHTYTNTSYGIYFNPNARLFLGCEANSANPSPPYFNGQESDFRMYATALSAAAIKELYTTSLKIVSGNSVARELSEL